MPVGLAWAGDVAKNQQLGVRHGGKKRREPTKKVTLKRCKTHMQKDWQANSGALEGARGAPPAARAAAGAHPLRCRGCGRG